MAILQVGAGAKATVTLSHDRRLHLRIKDFSKDCASYIPKNYKLR
ncbi:predicted protein [Botrytis cinerea T4]|uniref:Uncharacterized protein n=1 Tax=Botryotinia fuckeliana (strain T4) TaxID=999810 RepID=G2YWR6_BOTF4|nr:predicted protein [Botrytis cinerea T4]